MLGMILGLIQDFERRHGHRPQLVYLNDRHISALRHECPALLEVELSGRLGFVICRGSEYETPHPRVVWVPNLEVAAVSGTSHKSVSARIIHFPRRLTRKVG